MLSEQHIFIVATSLMRKQTRIIRNGFINILFLIKKLIY